MTGGIASAELVRITPDPPAVPYGESTIDINGDGIPELTYSGGVIIPLGTTSCFGTLTMNLYSRPGVLLVGMNSTLVGLGIGQTLGSSLDSGLEWIPEGYGRHLGSRQYCINAGPPEPWRGLLGDTSQPYIGVQFPSEEGMHFGWLRFGNSVGRDGYQFADAYIIEYAYQTEPGVPVTITPPPNAADAFEDAVELPAKHFKLWADNSTATSQSADPGLAPAGAGASLWWKWTAPTNGLMWVASQSGPFETVLGVYSGSALDDLQLVASTKEGCVYGVAGLVREVEFQAEQGTTYFIMLDSRQPPAGTAPVGEVHLEGVFSTVSWAIPFDNALRNPGYPILFSVASSAWDGELNYVTIEANGQTVAASSPGLAEAVWYNASPGPYTMRAVWHDSGGVVRRSPPLKLQVRPVNDSFSRPPFVNATTWAARAGNQHSTHEEGEPLAPVGTDPNSVWWRWRAPEDGVLTLNLPDGRGELSVALYSGYGPWEPTVSPLAANPAHPTLPGRLLNHVQVPVQAGQPYSFCVRTLKNTTGSWAGGSGCDPVFINGREFVIQLNYHPGPAGQVLVQRYSDQMMASFASPAGRVFVLEYSTDLKHWNDLLSGTTTGKMQFLGWPFRASEPKAFFRLQLGD